MSEIIKQLIENKMALSVITKKGSVLERHEIESYYGNEDYWWFKTDVNSRNIDWDRAAELSFQEKPQNRIFSVGRKRLMALHSEGLNPKIQFMAAYDSIELIVVQKPKLVWDFSQGDSIDKLAEVLVSGKKFRLMLSEGDGNWLNVPLEHVSINSDNSRYDIQTAITMFPSLIVNPKNIQDRQLEQIYSYLTLNNSYQPEDEKVRSSVAEFEMVSIDLWRGLFEGGTFITAYSAKEGKSFRYTHLKLYDMTDIGDTQKINI